MITMSKRSAATVVAAGLLASAGCGIGSSSTGAGGSGSLAYSTESTDCEKTVSGWKCFVKWAEPGQLIKLRLGGTKKVERVAYNAPSGDGDLASLAYQFNDDKQSRFDQTIPVAAQNVSTATRGTEASEITVILTKYRNLSYDSEALLGTIEVFGS